MPNVTTPSETADPYNAAIAEVFRMRKVEKRLTFEALEVLTGINLRTLKRLINGQRAIMLGNFIKLCEALDEDPADVIRRSADRVENTSS